MKKIIRIAALGAALCAIGTMMAGCTSDKYAEEFAKIGESSEKALAVVKAEMEITENMSVGENIAGVLESSSSYTYIQYEIGDNLTYKVSTNDGTSSYELFKNEKGTYEVKDDVLTEYTGEDPIFSEYIDLDFALEDVKAIEVAAGDKGTKLYTVEMSGAYADKFDTDINGGKYDCTAVKYVYKIDSLSRLKSVETEYTADFTYDGKTQTTVKTESVAFAEIAIQ